ncbi:cytochrome b561 and DOMON domain-containing-like protein [Cinnamomum micranthum f. kanehirae]|uniref:Cytochrome b561 and DOMON domain-containing-like protein n=1 Tax=Cinnamomum micranthum f. kanehirae TaxID=337451 RepID=A0A3S3M4E7_9MAGN|nr:cytochrome b561 and DOMON domain-containing-like protein [Cinnamomum micranthum f. kanehirae]
MASLLLLSLLLMIAVPCHSATCSSQKFTSHKSFDLCNDLPTLSSYLHWTYDPSISSLDFAFIAQPAQSNGWIAWAINPTGTGMVGSQSLIGFQQSSGSMIVKSFNISRYGPIKPSPIMFEVSDMNGEYLDGMMRIFGTMVLPKNMSIVNHVWQVGASVTDGIPDRHQFGSENLNSKGRLDLLKGQSTTRGTTDSRQQLRNIHGLLNALSWGTLTPMGVMLARYSRTFKRTGPAWFYLHVFCQCSAYAIGAAGWVIGLILGHQSNGVQYSFHRNLGITLFCLGTLQVFALYLRPNKDHNYRIYWNIYHHSVGYTVIVLSITNVFKGLDILNPKDQWRIAYVVVIIILGAIALALEFVTWILVLWRKSHDSTGV